MGDEPALFADHHQAPRTEFQIVKPFQEFLRPDVDRDDAGDFLSGANRYGVGTHERFVPRRALIRFCPGRPAARLGVAVPGPIGVFRDLCGQIDAFQLVTGTIAVQCAASLAVFFARFQSPVWCQTNRHSVDVHVARQTLHKERLELLGGEIGIERNRQSGGTGQFLRAGQVPVQLGRSPRGRSRQILLHIGESVRTIQTVFPPEHHAVGQQQGNCNREDELGLQGHRQCSLPEGYRVARACADHAASPRTSRSPIDHCNHTSAAGGHIDDSQVNKCRIFRNRVRKTRPFSICRS